MLLSAAEYLVFIQIRLPYCISTFKITIIFSRVVCKIYPLVMTNAKKHPPLMNDVCNMAHRMPVFRGNLSSRENSTMYAPFAVHSTE